MAFAHGVDDLVLLEDISNEGILATLKSRYNANLIYTYIGQVLIAVNPYQQLPIYGPNVVKTYQDRYIFEEPPHVYAIAEDAYHSLLTEGVNQTIIISGESGSGKTETSKFIMRYIAAVSGKGESVETVKDQILQSNPVLEAFGNAKTVQNDNSSRFGKYFEIQFNVAGDPTGGRITNYLLEKSRVVRQAKGERNFHIFYQLLEGASSQEKNELHLRRPQDFVYLNQSDCYTVTGVNDGAEFKTTKNAMNVIGLKEEEQAFLFRIVAAVLHLGNIRFVSEGTRTKVQNTDVLGVVAKLLGQNPRAVETALTVRTVTAGATGRLTETTSVPLDEEQANYTRDALAKTLYSRMFDWLVTRINENICDERAEFNIGVLDIYGFEIFEYNSFEQLCINFVNEKLQQIFIDLTLKTEQEEYQQEGIRWENVQYFDNKPCVDLIEGRGGIMSLLDEECVFPQGTDATFLAKLNRQCKNHQYFRSFDAKVAERNLCFGMEHYAGTVTYTVDGFLDKNKDTLFKDLRNILQASSDPLLAQLFPPDAVSSNKRPPTASLQFRNQVTALVTTLRSCTPHYIRCIRPNAQKMPNRLEDQLTGNQVRYLGLLENVRVRRAGYAYRQTYEKFMHRFRILSDKTFPRWDGNAQSGVQMILKEVNIKQNAGDRSAYEFGRTKIFIRNPQTLFTLEDLRLQKLNDVIKIIQKRWRECRGRAFARRVRQTVPDLFWGNKERRRDSVFRHYEGDYLKIKNSRIHKGIKGKFKEKRVLFSDKVREVEKGKPKDRLLVATEGALYVIGGTFRKKVVRRLPVAETTSIELSQFADGIVVFHMRDNQDGVFEIEKKTELVAALYAASVEAAREAGEADPKGIPVTFASGTSLTYQEKRTQRTILFSKDETLAGKVVIRPHGDSVQVLTSSGLDKSAGPRKRDKAKKPEKMRQINKAGGLGSHAINVVCSVKALHDYTARNARELSFKAGDVIQVTQKSVSGSWQGLLHGKTGVFPANYVTEI
jgi:myosin-1